MWEKLKRCYPPQFELVSLFIVLLGFYIALSNYSSLPDTIPTHFNTHGDPNEWGGKGQIFILPIISTVFFLFLTFLNFWFAIADDPRKLINLPGKRKEAMTKEQIETLRVFVNRCLFALKILTLGLFTYMTRQTTEIALGRTNNMGPLLWLLTGGISVLVGYMIWKSFLLTKANRDNRLL